MDWACSGDKKTRQWSPSQVAGGQLLVATFEPLQSVVNQMASYRASSSPPGPPRACSCGEADGELPRRLTPLPDPHELARAVNQMASYRRRPLTSTADGVSAVCSVKRILMPRDATDTAKHPGFSYLSSTVRTSLPAMAGCQPRVFLHAARQFARRPRADGACKSLFSTVLDITPVIVVQ